MKDFIRCLCGHGTDVKPLEPFIELGEVTGVETRFTRIGVKPISESKTFKKVACPKCGTVKILV